jgi:hypothetical protein
MAHLSTHSYFRNNAEEFISTPIKLSSSLHQYSTMLAQNAHETLVKPIEIGLANASWKRRQSAFDLPTYLYSVQWVWTNRFGLERGRRA